MTATLPSARPPDQDAAPVPRVDALTHAVQLDVVIPVYNAQRDLARSVRALHRHLTQRFPYPFRITVADNASTDQTLALAGELAAELDDVRVVHLPEKGRGGALHAVWSTSDAAVLAYTDVDLSTDLAAISPLVAPLLSGHSDLAIGSRLARGARIRRGAKRELLSRGYNLLLRGSLAVRFSDAQCGFKAIRADVAAALLPHVTDTGWFFDTELLVLAERAGLRIHEVPVDWVDDPDSTVDIKATVLADLRGIVRLGRALRTGAVPVTALRASLGRASLAARGPGRLAGQLARFALIGLLSTGAYLLLYLALRAGLGAQAANLVALGLTAIGNTALNRRLTFGVRGAGVLRQQAQGLLVFGVGLALTSSALALLQAADGGGGGLEVLVLLAANALATLVRFLLLRGWVFRAAR